MDDNFLFYLEEAGSASESSEIQRDHGRGTMTIPGLETSRRRRGHVYAVLALITCPCHLPILAVLLSGSAVGIFLNDHFAIAIVIFSLFFVCSLVAAVRVLRVKQAHDI